MQYTLLSSMLILSLVVLTACSSGDDDDSSPNAGEMSSQNGEGDNGTGGGDQDDASQNRFGETVVDEEVTLVDQDTSLEWVNGLSQGSAKPETGCNPLPAGLAEQDARDEALFFCDSLVFHGKTDWRLPTVTEQQTYMVALDGAGIIPFYQNPGCPRVVGLNADDTISTVDTHNTNVGTINAWNAMNAGVRCVRDVSM